MSICKNGGTCRRVGYNNSNISKEEGVNMKVSRIGRAGTMESGDICIVLEKSNTPEITIELDSTVASLFGKEIKSVIIDTLQENQIESGVKVVAMDKGALNCTIRARVTAAIYRATASTEYKWNA